MPLEKLVAFTKKVQDLPDKPNATMTAAEVKAQFDAAPEEVRVYLNKLIAVLESTTDGDSGADNVKATPIEGLAGDTVQTLLENLLGQIQETIAGQIPNGTITDVKLSDNPTEIKKRFAVHQLDDDIHKTSQQIRTESTTALRTEVVNSLPTAGDKGRILFLDEAEGGFKGDTGGEWV